MSIPITHANDINTVLDWAMDRPARTGRPPVSDEDATVAAKRLAGKAHKALSAGLRPEQVELARVPIPGDLEPACRVCGCTESAPCPRGCAWTEDPKMLGELCTTCEQLLAKAGLL